MPLDSARGWASTANVPGRASRIADYAAIGDCRSAALVSREGGIHWLCLPHFSAPSVFGALLDRDGGHFTIQPVAPFTSSRRYVGPTNVLETTFRTEAGTLRVTDLMTAPGKTSEIEPQREVLRIVEAVQGEVDMVLIAMPRPNYGRTRADIRSRGRLGFAWTWGNELLGLCADFPLTVADDGSVRGGLRLAAGERRRVSLCYTQGDIGVIPAQGAAADARLASTLAWWEEWSRQCRYAGAYGEAVLRSALVLKLMTYALSGAVIAAPTTSLPETPGGVRNWDYRYCWLRDAALTMRAFTGLGFRAEARAFFDWLLHTTRLTWPQMHVLYDVYGRPDTPEIELAHWDGYGGARPVRTGNAAQKQLQLDVYGAVAYAARNFIESGGELTAGDARLLRALCRAVCRLWREPDNGIWEVRGARRHYSFSKAMCWIALDSVLKLRSAAAVRMPEQDFHSQMAAIEALVESRGFDSGLNSYIAEFDGDTVDASLLLLGCLGYKDPKHPRMHGTFEQVWRRLSRNGLLLRYEEGYDGLPGREGAFGICSFWAIDQLACQGRIEEARRAFAHVLSFANDVGLFAEEIEPHSGAALGNFPQAYTHVGLINAALALSKHQ